MAFQKPQKTIVKETRRMAIGVAICVAVMIAVYAVLGRLTLGVVLGVLLGGAYAVFNFFMLGMTVQEAASMQTPELAQMKMRTSYSMRMVGMVLLVVIAFALPFVDGIACMIPMVFPRFIILVLQLTGKIKDE